MPIFFLAGAFSFSLSCQDQLVVDGFYFYCLPAGFVLLLLLAESFRIPFDLPEAESELVAGYTIEYGAIPFACFFLGESLSIFSGALVLLSFFYPVEAFIFVGIAGFYILVLLYIFLIVWIRATLPRVRYDILLSVS